MGFLSVNRGVLGKLGYRDGFVQGFVGADSGGLLRSCCGNSGRSSSARWSTGNDLVTASRSARDT
jgi:hypothetical protein